LNSKLIETEISQLPERLRISLLAKWTGRENRPTNARVPYRVTTTLDRVQSPPFRWFCPV
jgi:hypothetical protein